MSVLKIYSKQDLLSLVRIRRFETKLGERLQVLADSHAVQASLAQSKARFVVLGIPEDLGVKANGGEGGADSAWMPFLQAFVNIQSNDFLVGEDVLVLGHFDFSALAQLVEENAHQAEEKLEAYRHAVNTIDDAVEQVVQWIVEAGKFPIVIGGGHNNAYPCIKGAAKGLYKAGKIPFAKINAINLDAHTDYRPMEGRHSGNAFTYAEADGYLEKYCAIGVHENYIPQSVWMEMVNNPFVDCVTYEDIFLHEKRSFLQAVAHATGFVGENYCGIELDLDGIEHTLSSAETPVGITPLQARQYLNFAAADSRPAYLLLAEGATQLRSGKSDTQTGKLLAYLVSDFIKAMGMY
ncbi:MAG: arginase [Sphingobacteriia bacterium]|nr:MAG: arginase [Sphingobacteriia bacterium]